MERPLSGAERMMHLFSEQIHANGCVGMRLRGLLDDAKLRAALERLPRKHPLLTARIVRKQDVLTFTTEAAPSIPLQVVTDDGSGQSVFEIMKTELVAWLDPSSDARARFTLIRHRDGEWTDLVITADHTVADAIACFYALRDLLTSHESPETEFESSPLPPHVAHLFPPSSLDAAAPQLAVPQTATPPSTSMFAVSTSDIMIFTAKLASESVQMLRRRCKEEGVTVHSAICAAFGESFAVVAENKTRVTISNPISYRHRLDPAVRDTVSCSIAFAQVQLELSPRKSLWEQAHAVQQQLLEWRADQKLFAGMAAIEAVNQAERDDSRFLDRIRQGAKSSDIAVSNIGVLPIPDRYGNLTIEAVYGIACLPGDICVNLINLDGALHISLGTRGLSRAANEAARRMVDLALSRLSMLPS